ncbi:CobW family GTP-binding protein [Acanthopleuribacter pedis]|uniref:GTP-binding protein n=1 Tax=Acanthopleuribacter pedis TaxID=442870 RepID=A0A8J7Q2G0_9BACT|nr:GTP-binding protein [Acanthopleuribacter pedis]MBO1317469.1 GTP-binding protein [Acanthopleuribacter pedis]
MIPVTIISGFLGSGKTTLLNQILRQKHEERVAVLVNDFGAIDIDGELVVGVSGEKLALSGGCICCTIRGDLQETVLDLIQGEDAPHRLVIEASGVSDPTAVAMTFFTGPLKAKCRVETLVTVVDSEHFFETDPKIIHLLDRQLVVADLVLLNKVDVCPAKKIQNVENVIRTEYPDARVVHTRFAEVPRQLIFEPVMKAPIQDRALSPLDSHVHGTGDPHHHHDDHTLVFDTWSTEIEAAVDRDQLLRVLTTLPTQIYRAKGFIFCQDMVDREIVVHLAGRRVQQFMGKPWADRKPSTRLVFIARQGFDGFGELDEQLKACARDAPKPSRVPSGWAAWKKTFEDRVRQNEDA